MALVEPVGDVLNETPTNAAASEVVRDSRRWSRRASAAAKARPDRQHEAADTEDGIGMAFELLDRVHGEQGTSWNSRAAVVEFRLGHVPGR